jgi:hypothetical protein
MSQVKSGTEPGGNSFELVVRNQRRGALLAELSTKLSEAVMAVKEHSKPATVTLVLTIDPANGDASAVRLQDEVKVKLPRKPQGASLFYTTDDNRLVRDDPHQTEMALEVVKAQPVEAVDESAAG